MSVRAALSIALAVALAAPASRAADPAAQARELFQKGVQALAGNRSQEAIDAFEAAYKSSNSPSMLFYLGEAYRQAGNRQKALEEYQGYVEKMPAGPKRAEADAHIGELKKGGGPAPAPAAAPAPAKRKMALDDMDLNGAPAKEAPKVAAKEPAKAAKKMQLDDMDLGSKPAAPAAAAAEPPKEKRRRTRKTEEAMAIAQAPAQPAPAAAPAKEPPPIAAQKAAPAPEPVAAIPAPSPTPAPAPAPVAAPIAAAPTPAAESESSRAAPSLADSGLPRPTRLEKAPAPEIVPSQPTRPSEPIREASPLTQEDMDLAMAMAGKPPAPKPAPAAVPAPKPAPPANTAAAKPPPPPVDEPGALPRPASRLTPSTKVATTASAPRSESILPRAESYAPPAVAVISAPAPSGTDGSGQRAAGLIIGTVGVAALATGGLLGVGAKTAANDLNATAQDGGQYDPSVQTRGKRDQALEIVFLAAGGAALATGVLVYALAPSSNARASNDDGAPVKPDSTPRLASATLAPLPGGMAATARLSF